ncbi:MAG: hypothetical protein SCARUB_00260 [Candidatus Scalindua rubra]|uniref:Uncharacterized protein n=1 Tax=Candidatus Scalindua rubra TaxID=1872076 RepID=A0A1E3XFX6_9BACT|nr:MAG: hypothetical protein SCARUB_00260 [Candidatus Scalindua rubra]
MGKINYRIGRLSEEEQFKLDFTDGLSRSVYERIELGFITMKLPVIDDESYRIFDTMEEYHKWANENIPNWLGYNTHD